MENFKDFGIKKETKGFKGDSIKTSRLLNREIEVHAFKIEDSKQEAGTKCLHLQIKIGETWHVVFTGGKSLIEDIQQVPKFPFKTTIVKENEWLKFT